MPDGLTGENGIRPSTMGNQPEEVDMTTLRTSIQEPRRKLPRSIVIVRLALGATAALLLAWVAITAASHVGAGLSGTTLVFTREDLETSGGPAPMEGDPGVGPGLSEADTVGGIQYVDVPPLALTVVGGLVAAAGAWLLPRGSRWSVPAALAGMAVATAVGLFPALIGASLMDIYRLELADIAIFLVVGAALAAAGLVGMAAVWRHRREIGPVSG